MTNEKMIDKLKGFTKGKQLLIAIVLSVAIFAIFNMFLQVTGGGLDYQTIGYLLTLPVCYFMIKSIFVSAPEGKNSKAKSAEDFYEDQEK